MSSAKLIGKVTLWTLIGFGLLALGAFALGGYWYWFATIAGCFACVITAEIVSFIFLKKSISTQYGEFLNKKPLLGILGLVFFSLSMLSLVSHLVAYAFR